MHQIRFWLGLCPRSCWGSLQHCSRPLSWIKGVLLFREEGQKKEGMEMGEEVKVSWGEGR